MADNLQPHRAWPRGLPARNGGHSGPQLSHQTGGTDIACVYLLDLVHRLLPAHLRTVDEIHRHTQLDT